MKLPLLILTGLTLVATGCSHKDDGGRQRPGGGVDRHGEIHGDRGRGDRGRLSGPLHRRVRIRPHGPLASAITCIDEQGGQEQILMSQFPDGDSDLNAGTQFSIGGRSVRVMSRSLDQNSGTDVTFNVQDVSTGEIFQTQCNAF